MANITKRNPKNWKTQGDVVRETPASQSATPKAVEQLACGWHKQTGRKRVTQKQRAHGILGENVIRCPKLVLGGTSLESGSNKPPLPTRKCHRDPGNKGSTFTPWRLGKTETIFETEERRQKELWIGGGGGGTNMALKKGRNKVLAFNCIKEVIRRPGPSWWWEPGA